jgi:hypothetical protein
MSNKNCDKRNDRLMKYGFGFIRLLALLLLLTYFDGGFRIEKIGNFNRCLIYIFYALYGACLNVELFGSISEKVFFFSIICLCIYDLSFDYTVLLYATKTFIPDFFASKLDRAIWKFLLILSISAVLFCFFFPLKTGESILDLSMLWFIMALGQLFCEMGDQHFEHLTFFRHRYSFEFTMLIIWYFMPAPSGEADYERRFFYFDMVAALSYRGTGFILKYLDLDFRKIELNGSHDYNKDDFIKIKKEY